MSKYLLFLLAISTFPDIIAAQVKLSGHVIEMTTGEPIRNATVFIHDEFNIAFNPPVKFETDSNGYFEFQDLEPGTYSINAYVIYEFRGDRLAYVYQPGTFEIRDRIHRSSSRGYSYNFTFSEVEFQYYYQFQNVSTREYSEIDNSFWATMQLLRPRVETNCSGCLKLNETKFIEKIIR